MTYPSNPRWTKAGFLGAATLWLCALTWAACGTANQAIPCRDSTQCPHGDVCTNERCVPALASQACTSSSDCPSGETCLAGLCHSGSSDAGGSDTSCMSDSDCSSSSTDPFCVGGLCVECRSTADCGSPIKDCSDSNQCVYALGNCGSNADCTSLSTTPVCNTSENLCVGCVQDSDCNSGYVCSMETSTCTLPGTGGCTSDSECSAPEVCINGSCGLSRGGSPDAGTGGGCASNADCASDPSGPVCDTTQGLCVECVQDTDCPTGETCVSDTCSGGSGTCSTNADCSSSNPVCDPTSGTCGPCSFDSDCPSGETCQIDGSCGSGTGQNGGACTSSSDCSTDGAGSRCIGSFLGIIPGTCGCRRSSDCSYAGGTCDRTSETCTGGGSTGGGGGTGCLTEIECINACNSQSCADGCVSAASTTGQNLYDALGTCLEAACPSSSTCSDPTSNACNNCYSSAQESGGACYSDYQACEQSG